MMHTQKVCINHFMDQLKVCSKCKESKAHSEFSKNKSSKDKLSYQCKVCYREYRNKERGCGVTWFEEEQENYEGYRVSNVPKKILKQRVITRLRVETNRIFKIKGNKRQKDIRSREILGVGYEEAYVRLLETIPVGYTEMDWLEGRLEIDHKIPLSWFNLDTEKEIKEAGNISNLQLLPREENLLKSNNYGHLDTGGIILYEEWLLKRQVIIISH